VKTKATSAAVPTAALPRPSGTGQLVEILLPTWMPPKRRCSNGCGLEANTMLVSRDTFLELKEHPKVLAKIQYVDRGIVTVDILKAVFGVDELPRGRPALQHRSGRRCPEPRGGLGQVVHHRTR
jgi:hypothetical protein